MDRFNDYKETNPTIEKPELDKKKGKCEIDEETKKMIKMYMLLYWIGMALLFVLIFGLVAIFKLHTHFCLGIFNGGQYILPPFFKFLLVKNVFFIYNIVIQRLIYEPKNPFNVTFPGFSSSGAGQADAQNDK